jgi:hypothetical protein
MGTLYHIMLILQQPTAPVASPDPPECACPLSQPATNPIKLRKNPARYGNQQICQVRLSGF